MKIVRIIGGLGNQMFQYAFALSLKQMFPDEVILIDKNAFRGYPLHNGYILEKIFALSIRQASISEIFKVSIPLPHYRLWQIGKRLIPKMESIYEEKEDMVFDSEVYSVIGSTYYDGYWQSEKYFSSNVHIVRNEFRFPDLDKRNKEFVCKYAGKTTVSIHVRRGDYLKEPLFKNIADIFYYQKAIERIKNLTDIDCFIVFSNDIEWCKKNLSELFGQTESSYVNWNHGIESYKDMQLMSLCSHNIIANSSFSWWGAWLNENPDKIVISPSKWINRQNEIDIIPNTWIKV